MITLTMDWGHQHMMLGVRKRLRDSQKREQDGMHVSYRKGQIEEANLNHDKLLAELKMLRAGTLLLGAPEDTAEEMATLGKYKIDSNWPDFDVDEEDLVQLEYTKAKYLMTFVEQMMQERKDAARANPRDLEAEDDLVLGPVLRTFIRQAPDSCEKEVMSQIKVLMNYVQAATHLRVIQRAHGHLNGMKRVASQLLRTEAIGLRDIMVRSIQRNDYLDRQQRLAQQHPEWKGEASPISPSVTSSLSREGQTEEIEDLTPAELAAQLTETGRLLIQRISEAKNTGCPNLSMLLQGKEVATDLVDHIGELAMSVTSALTTDPILNRTAEEDRAMDQVLFFDKTNKKDPGKEDKLPEELTTEASVVLCPKGEDTKATDALDINLGVKPKHPEAMPASERRRHPAETASEGSSKEIEFEEGQDPGEVQRVTSVPNNSMKERRRREGQGEIPAHKRMPILPPNLLLPLRRPQGQDGDDDKCVTDPPLSQESSDAAWDEAKKSANKIAARIPGLSDKDKKK